MSNAPLQLASDVELLTRFRKRGDELAFKVIVQRHSPQVLATCRRLMGDPGQADDAVQETFFRLVKRPGAVRSNLGGWLHRTATRICFDRHRSTNRRTRREAIYARGTADTMSRSDVVQDALGAAGSESGTTPWSEIEPHIDRALARLKDQEAEVLIGHFLRGETLKHMAHDQGVSASAMSQRLKRALAHLRSELAASGFRVGLVGLAALLAQAPAAQASAGLVTSLGSMAMASGFLGSGSMAAGSVTMASSGGLGSTLAGTVSTVGGSMIKTGLAVGVSAGLVATTVTLWPDASSPIATVPVSRPSDNASNNPLPTAQLETLAPAPIHTPTPTPAPATPAQLAPLPLVAEVSYLVVAPNAQAFLQADANRPSLIQHPNSLPADGLLTVVFADGHVERLPRRDIDNVLRRFGDRTLNDLIDTAPQVSEP